MSHERSFIKAQSTSRKRQAGLGFLVGVGLAYGAGALIGRLFPEMLVLIEPVATLRQIPVLSAVTAVAALLPLGRISRTDPMVVFRV